MANALIWLDKGKALGWDALARCRRCRWRRRTLQLDHHLAKWILGIHIVSQAAFSGFFVCLLFINQDVCLDSIMIVK